MYLIFYSFGTTLWEIFTLGAVPFGGLAYNAAFPSALESKEIYLDKPPNATEEM